jgi:hypothetical protein
MSAPLSKELREKHNVRITRNFNPREESVDLSENHESDE